MTVAELGLVDKARVHLAARAIRYGLERELFESNWINVSMIALLGFENNTLFAKRERHAIPADVQRIIMLYALAVTESPMSKQWATTCWWLQHCTPAEHQLMADIFTRRFNERKEGMKPSETIPADIMARLNESLGQLEQALLKADDKLPQHSRNIHQLLLSYPETVHLLEDHEIERIIDGLEVVTQQKVVTAKEKSSSTTKSLKKLTPLDL